MRVRDQLGLPSGNVPNGYWALVHLAAERVGSDGCSSVTELFREGCLEHDVHYRTGKTVLGRELTRRQSDAAFREVIQDLSPLGILSVMAWIRWIGVRLLGRKAWKGN